MTADKLSYSIPEAAAQLSIGARTLWRMIKAGEIRTARLGSRVLVPRASLEAFLAAHMAPVEK